MVTLANGLSHMLFYHQTWTNFPQDFHCTVTFQLLLTASVEMLTVCQIHCVYMTCNTAAQHYPSIQANKSGVREKWPPCYFKDSFRRGKTV